MLNFSVANQIFKTSSNEEYVIVGNDALMKCIIPSFVSDWVAVVGWEDSEGHLYHRDRSAIGNAAVFPSSNIGRKYSQPDTQSTWLCFL